MKLLLVFLVCVFAQQSSRPSDPTFGWQTIVLEKINTLRVGHGLQPLVWSNNLAILSAKTTDQCLWYHFTQELAKYGVSENIAWGLGQSQAVDLWAAQGESYNVETNACNLGAGKCDQFKALMWSGTQQIGCAYNDGCLYKNDQTFAFGEFACRLWPAGLLDGQRPFGAFGEAGVAFTNLGSYAGQLATRASPTGIQGPAAIVTVTDVILLCTAVFASGLCLTLGVALAAACMAQRSPKGYSNLDSPRQAGLSGWQKVAIGVLAGLTLAATITCAIVFGLQVNNSYSINYASRKTLSASSQSLRSETSSYSPLRLGVTCYNLQCAAPLVKQEDMSTGQCSCQTPAVVSSQVQRSQSAPLPRLTQMQSLALAIKRDAGHLSRQRARLHAANNARVRPAAPRPVPVAPAPVASDPFDDDVPENLRSL